MESPYQNIWRDGLWHNNAGLVQLLGLCPLLAVSSTVVYGLGLGLATTFTLVLSNAIVSLSRGWISPEVRIPVFVVIIAAAVTLVELVIHAFAFELYQALGIFLPLIVTNCAIIARAEAFASRNGLGPAAADGLAIGLGFTAVLLVLGAMREILGRGTLFDQMELVLGEWGARLVLDLPGLSGFLPALLPPGAFICLGLLVAAKKALDNRGAREIPAGVPEPQA